MAFIDRLSGICGGSRVLAWLLAVNIVMSLALWAALAAIELSGGDSSLLYAVALPSDPLLFAAHPWTLATYMAVHFSPIHMLVNMLWLLWFGRLFSGSGRETSLLWLYLGSGVCGGLFYIAASAVTGYAPGTYLTGASAAVLGVTGATAMLMPSRRVNLFLLGEVRLIWVATGCIVLTVAGSWGAGIPPQAAHIGGLAFGVATAFARKYSGPRISGKAPAAAVFRPDGRGQGRYRLNARRTLDAINRMPDDHERLDQLLDKIRMSGYGSLTARERTELNHISSKIKQ
ncbi:MAG: rhomboid family intramembrane serine protease [Muribaculaceae bacterium]|nr:rhomboid family intramembrane serine protease [Muribaculaceae bacterium]